MTARDRMTAPVPVLLVTGPVGVGKTVVTDEAARLLSEAGIPHAMADLAVIGGAGRHRQMIRGMGTAGHSAGR